MLLGLPSVTPGNRVRAMVLGYLAFCMLYLGSFALSHPRATYLEPSLWDEQVPGIPSSLWVYLSQFVLLPLAFLLEDRSARLTRAYYAMLAATILSCAVFLIWPTTVGQSMAATHALTAEAWRWLYLFDVPGNCFPSLHVALAMLAGWLLAGRRGPWLWLAPVWSLAIALSTLTTRQHRLIDVAGGAAIAFLCLWLTAGQGRRRC